MRYSHPASTVVLAVLMSLPPLSEARADAADGYSHTMTLTVSGKEALVQLRLPKDVYLHARSAELDDLRLFDQHGAAVPFALTLPQEQARVSLRSVPVAIFPVMGGGSGAKASAGLDIRTSADGSLVSVTTQVRGSAPASGKLSGLVLDLRAAKAGGDAPAQLSALRLTLPKTISNYTARIALEVSDDLKQWDSLGESVVSWLTNADTLALASDRIEFDARAFRYARLSWREGEPIAFAGIVAEVRQQSEAAPALDTVVLQPQPGKYPNDVLYQSAPAIPVQSFSLQFAQQNMVVPAVVGRYVELPALKPGSPARWDFAPSFRATFFQLTQAGHTRSSGALALSCAHAAQWVLRPQAPLAALPSLRLGWQPASMVFVANGTGPFTLAVGRDHATGVQADIAQVAPGFSARELLALEHAVAGPLTQHSAMPEAASAAQAAGISAQGRARILWGALLLGVAVLGAMAWALVRQMNGAPVESGGSGDDPLPS